MRRTRRQSHPHIPMSIVAITFLFVTHIIGYAFSLLDAMVQKYIVVFILSAIVRALDYTHNINSK